jgi:response regulator NasT
LLANESVETLERLAQIVVDLGHEVMCMAVNFEEVGALTLRESPDVALVSLGLSTRHALTMIERIVRESNCPVIALLSAEEPAYIHEAAKRGVFAYIVNASSEELESALDITLERFAEYHELQGAFGRRAVIEQAKGILMARHGIGADKAFERLRDQSQNSGEKLADIASAVVQSHRLLPMPSAPPGDA